MEIRSRKTSLFFRRHGISLILIGLAVLVLLIVARPTATVKAVGQGELPETEELEEVVWDTEVVVAITEAGSIEGENASMKLLNVEWPSEISDDITLEDITWLSKIMMAERGPDWPDWLVMAIGEVVLNRVESTEFPDSIIGVLTEKDPVQYEPVYSDSWTQILPTEHDVELAIRLLKGERILNDKAVVFQSQFILGSQIVLTYYDTSLGTTTYFCRATNMNLYR